MVCCCSGLLTVGTSHHSASLDAVVGDAASVSEMRTYLRRKNDGKESCKGKKIRLQPVTWSDIKKSRVVDEREFAADSVAGFAPMTAAVGENVVAVVAAAVAGA